MWLFIDTRNRGEAVFGWLKPGAKTKFWPVSANDNGLVSALSRKISGEQLSGSDGICVVDGPGSFSSIRIGTLTANLLARIHGLPLYRVGGDTADKGSQAVLEAMAQDGPKAYVAPVYDREPNITIKTQ